MLEEKKCAICGKLFTPSLRRPDQTVCLSPVCQKKRQLNNMRQWRAKKAASSEGRAWREECRRKSAEWRKKHHAYLKLYREEHRKERSQYMKEYMRGYRKGGKHSEKTADKDKSQGVL